MSKANVAQEPSMDEILASIRRIIETGDEKAAGASREAAVGAARHIPAFLAGETVRDMPGQRGDLGRVSSHPSFSTAPESDSMPYRADEPVGSAQPLFPAFSDDDRLTAELETELAATWERIEIDRHPPTAAVTPFDAAPVGRPTVRSDAMSNEPDIRAFGGPSEAHTFQQPAESASPAPSASSSAPSYEAPMERSAFEPANTDARVPEEPVTSSRYGDTPPPLVSPTTGQLVGASFNELAEAIRQGELRSLEAMAQEMLQPMLRDWLDDNLPKMVERLIREEIERLARGGAKR